jgi:hypothetical protein
LIRAPARTPTDEKRKRSVVRIAVKGHNVSELSYFTNSYVTGMSHKRP